MKAAALRYHRAEKRIFGMAVLLQGKAWAVQKSRGFWIKGREARPAKQNQMCLI